MPLMTPVTQRALPAFCLAEVLVLVLKYAQPAPAAFVLLTAHALGACDAGPHPLAQAYIRQRILFKAMILRSLRCQAGSNHDLQVIILDHLWVTAFAGGIGKRAIAEFERTRRLLGHVQEGGPPLQ